MSSDSNVPLLPVPHPGRLPVSGFVEVNDGRSRYGWQYGKMTLEWTATGAKKFPWQADWKYYKAADWWPNVMAGGYAISADRKHGKGEGFRRNLAEAIEAAKRMPDGGRGILVFGRGTIRTVLKRAPAPVLKVLIEEASSSPIEPCFDERHLVAVTRANATPLILCLDAIGNLTVVASRWKGGAGYFAKANMEVRSTGAMFLDAKLELQKKVSLRLADLAGLSPVEAAEKLAEYFWNVVSPALTQPFVPKYRQVAKSYDELRREDIACRNGSVDLLMDGLGRLISVALTNDIFDVGEYPHMLEPGHAEWGIGFMAGRPCGTCCVGEAIIFPEGFIAVARALVDRVEPVGAAPVDAHKPSSWGNRDALGNWRGYREWITFAEIHQESAHYHLESEGRLIEVMLEIGFSDQEVATLLAGIH
jgi:hypothetical protein